MPAPSSTFEAFDAQGYEALMGRWSRRLAHRVIEFSGAVPGERVLDVGCGTGSLAFTLAELAPPAELQGVDLAAPYVAEAQARNTDARLHFQVADACALPFEDASFDRVFSLLMLHFVPRGADAIAEMKRVARPGATVCAAVWDARGGFIANRMFFDTAAALDPAAGEMRARNYTRPMTRPGELGAAWRAAGFEQVEETSLGIRMDFANFADFWAPYAAKDGPQAMYVSTLAEAPRERLRQALEGAFLDGETDGPRSYAALAWTVKGRAPG